MTLLACLQAPPPPKDTQLFSDGLFDGSGVVLLLAMALAAAAAPVLRWRYRVRVMRLMGLNQVAAGPAGQAATAAEQTTEKTAEPAAMPAPSAVDLASLAGLAQQRERRVARATAAAWLVFVGFGAVVAGVEPTVTPGGRVGFALSAGLLALGPALLNLPPRWSRRAWLGAAAIGLPGVLLMLWLNQGAADSAAAQGSTGDGLSPAQVLLFAVGILLVYLISYSRSLRGQVLPVFVVLGTCALAFFLAFDLMQRLAGACVHGLSQAAEGTIANALFVLAGGLVLVATAALGFWLLRTLAALIDRGWLNELSMAAAINLALLAVWLVVAQVPAVDVVPLDQQPVWWALMPLPWLGLSAAAYALALGRPPARATPGPALLVLRVFSADSKRHSLLDNVQARWRYVGAVHQIGGPDMLAMNIDPQEAAMFLSNRLHELFLPEAPTLAALHRRLPQAPDHEGRYRINELFCFNSAWRQTVERLMHLSAVVVLDLRGFTAQREGTGYEIARLAECGLLPRVVALGDSVTEWDHVHGLLQAAGCTAAQLARLDLADGERLFQQLLHTAAQRLDAGPQPQARQP